MKEIILNDTEIGVCYAAESFVTKRIQPELFMAGVPSRLFRSQATVQI